MNLRNISIDYTCVNGNSFFGDRVKCSVKTMRGAFGSPSFLENSGRDKTTHEWILKFSNGESIALYDYKYYRILNDTEIIEWHIGARNSLVSKIAQDKIVKIIQQEIIRRNNNGE